MRKKHQNENPNPLYINLTSNNNKAFPQRIKRKPNKNKKFPGKSEVRCRLQRHSRLMADFFGKPNGPSAARVCNHFLSTKRAPKKELVQRWKYPICCCSKKDIACHIIISNIFLVLVASSQPQYSI
ncbi:hypothetical protein CEXT_618811 [Caerostris extrusa]|uniref:Uncharacterized protein n=1 Tax=Caerostris extrusa TaxID=172846 RepID=A0AAV4QYM8_CAEEX|nr:hypothetical protein CEXT_618811 [Caerostris extrusa]